ncbi:aspartate/glutamate racemase family protein [Streptococcus dentiloxodontae]
MKKIGLIGGTGPESTLIYYKEITQQVFQKTGHFPNLSIESLSVFEVLDYCQHKEYGNLTNYLLRGVYALKAAGAEVAALTAVTPHVVYEKLIKLSPLPLISILDSTRQAVEKAGYRKVLLLGTQITMQQGFFQKAFNGSEVEIVTPKRKDAIYIAEKISSELEHGIITKETQAAFARIVEEAALEGTDAVVLACTELPLAFSGLELPVEIIDVIPHHIAALVDSLSVKM